jgi:hypothetical protein
MTEIGMPNLRPREFRAIRALLTEPTIEKAAKAAKVGERTLHRWMRRDDFREAFDSARKEALSISIASLQSTTAQAVHALRTVLTDEIARPGDRISAARIVLEYALRGAELLDLEQRMAALEVDSRVKGR